MQIGDGFLVSRVASGEYELIFTPDKGEYANQTAFITTEKVLESLQVHCGTTPSDFLCAATDGLENVALKQPEWLPFAPFFEPLESYLQETDDPESNPEYLESFLNSERLNERTQDDKTLLLGMRSTIGIEPTDAGN